MKQDGSREIAADWIYSISVYLTYLVEEENGQRENIIINLVRVFFMLIVRLKLNTKYK